MTVLWLCIISFLTRIFSAEISEPKPKLLLFSVPGLRNDFIQNGVDFPGFSKLKDRGVWASYLEPHFPTSMFPSYATLVTGVYPENHGIIGDYMFDQSSQEYFVRGTINDRSKSTWFQGLPLWETAKKQDKNISLHWWPGCDSNGMAIDRKLCSHGASPSLERAKYAVEEVLEKFTKNILDGALINVDEVDFYGQFDGLGYWYRRSVENVDSFLSFVESRLTEYELIDTVNLLVLSPYGISWPNPPSNIIVLSTYVPEIGSYFSNFFGGSYLPIYVPRDKFSGVYRRLAAAHQHLKVYDKWNAPGHWNLGIGNHVPSLIVVADPGWIVVMTPKDAVRHWNRRGGYNGYDPASSTDMMGFFMAAGPFFKKNYQFESIDLIDVYQILAFSMGLSPEANRGNVKEIEHLFMLEDQDHITESYNTTTKQLQYETGDPFALFSVTESNTVRHLDPVYSTTAYDLTNITVTQRDFENSKVTPENVLLEMNFTVTDTSPSTVDLPIYLNASQTEISVPKLVIINLKTGNLYQSEDEISTKSPDNEEILFNTTVTDPHNILDLSETSTLYHDQDMSNVSFVYDSLSSLENDATTSFTNSSENLIAELQEVIPKSDWEGLEPSNFSFDSDPFVEQQNFSSPTSDHTEKSPSQFQNLSTNSSSKLGSTIFPGENNTTFPIESFSTVILPLKDETTETTKSLITLASDYASDWSEKIGIWFKKRFISRG